MLSLVGEFLSRLASWAESYLCHDAEPGLRGATYHQRCKANLKALGARICPTSGRRAPECAAGAIYDLLIGLFEIGRATLLMADPVRRLSAESRARVIRDFASIRRHVLYMFTSKLRFWKQLPWGLHVIAHHDLAIARDGGRRCLQLYAFTADAVHHWSAHLLCKPGTLVFFSARALLQRQAT